MMCCAPYNEAVPFREENGFCNTSGRDAKARKEIIDLKYTSTDVKHLYRRFNLLFTPALTSPIYIENTAANRKHHVAIISVLTTGV